MWNKSILMNNWLVLLPIMLLLGGLLSLPAAAATFTVTNDLDSGAGSLRQAIIDANGLAGADTIIFDSPLVGAIITLTTGEIIINDDLTISGLGALSLEVNGNNNSRIFTVNSGKTVNISDLTLKNGNATLAAVPRGGAILNYGILTISQSILNANRAESGGAIRNFEPTGQLTITSSTLSNNIATSGGGGAVVNTSAATTSAVKIQNCIVSGNTATVGGGALFNSSPGTMNVIASTVSGNTAKGAGGISNDVGSTLKVLNSTLSGNTSNGGAGYGGGGLYQSGTADIINSTLSGNSSTHTGGGLENTGTLTVTNSTITGNSANYGGGIYTTGSSGELTIGNSLIAGNSAPSGPEIEVGSGTFTSQGHNLFGVQGTAGLSGATPNTVLGDFVPGTYVFIDNLLEPLASNGGLTKTHLPLPGLAGETAIDAGDNGLATAAGLTTDDQRGVGYPRIVNSLVDIGAVESAILTTFTATASVIGSNGTILPPIRIVASGATTTFTVTPNPGYVATMSEMSGMCGGSLAGTTYTTNAIIGDCTVEATFNLVPLAVTNLNDDNSIGSLRDVITLANVTPGPNTITFDPNLTGPTSTITLASGEIAITDDLIINGPGDFHGRVG